MRPETTTSHSGILLILKFVLIYSRENNIVFHRQICCICCATISGQRFESIEEILSAVNRSFENLLKKVFSL